MLAARSDWRTGMTSRDLIWSHIRPLVRHFAGFLLSEMPARTYPAPYNDGSRRAILAVGYGALCHGLFGIAALTMISMMFLGMSSAFGRLDAPWSWIANLALVAQFPIGHSLLLTNNGRKLLRRLAPPALAGDLSSTLYVMISSVQIFMLFALWTPTGIVWWQAKGWLFWVMTAVYAAAWGLLGKASMDAGIEVQSGALGWTSVARGVRPVYPDMPSTGLFRVSRQPIYVAFALTLWTPPTWTPDQVALAVTLTSYCLIGPRFKERRFERLFGDRFRTYRAHVPYWLPTPWRRS